MKKAAADDPMEFVAVGFPSPAEYDAVREMAKCFIEEFALMGRTEEHILGLFKKPFYQGPYTVCQSRGEEYVRDLIREVFAGRELEGAKGERDV